MAAQPKGWSITERLCKGILPRYADDGFRCPGHPDWKSRDTHRALMANRCSNLTWLQIHGDKLLVMTWQTCAVAA